MSTPIQHRNIGAGEIHGIANWSVADSTERDALVVAAADRHKVCFVVDEVAYYALAVVTPTPVWVLLGQAPE
jgi:hypothetical protein